jgi:hypothetical protein
MDIRVNPKHFNKVKKAFTAAHVSVNKNVTSLNADPAVDDAVMVVKNGQGVDIEWFRGLDKVLSFLQYGYVRVQKFCPLLKRKCIAEKCAHYLVMRNVGDCTHIWSSVIHLPLV